jgi:hypothetical protein
MPRHALQAATRNDLPALVHPSIFDTCTIDSGKVRLTLSPGSLNNIFGSSNSRRRYRSNYLLRKYDGYYSRTLNLVFYKYAGEAFSPRPASASRGFDGQGDLVIRAPGKP